MRFPFYKQLDQMDCGPTCLRMVSKYYGKSLTRVEASKCLDQDKHGVSLLQLSNAAEKLGFRSLGVRIQIEKLAKERSLPYILYWDAAHFVVVYKVSRGTIFIADPAYGKVRMRHEEFIDSLKENSSDNSTAIALFLSPAKDFKKELSLKREKNSWWFVLHYLKPYKGYLLQLFIGLFASSLIQLAFPILTQNIIDIGIVNKDLNFITLLLFCQLFLFIGKTSIEIIRSWLILHISERISIAMLSDFFMVLMRKSMSFFDRKLTGDILQRINDHKRVENLLTNGTLSVLFSSFNLIVFSLVLITYSQKLFALFFIGSAIYIGWVLLFMKYRKELDYVRFSRLSDSQGKVIELVSGMQEIKLNNAEKEKRWSWEFIQVSLYKISIKSLTLEQIQLNGASAINELKNIAVLFLSASLVIKGEITLGAMLAVSYIIGQLNSPLSQLVSFFHSLQDAEIAVERINELSNDEEISIQYQGSIVIQEADIHINNLSYRYSINDGFLIDQLDLIIEQGKITAIVGESGSGKSTLLKLLLKFYTPQLGSIAIGRIQLNHISEDNWANYCGSVMQEGYIFNDTIEMNIALGDLVPDRERINESIRIANLEDWISTLPQGISTKIGMDGQNLSGGQKQRILIARAVYKQPSLFLFDEATSSLDAVNERTIMENLYQFMKSRTAIIVAHRLSTVKNADKIVVMNQGKISEIGDHYSLLEIKGEYYRLVNNQLQLAKAS